MSRPVRAGAVREYDGRDSGFYAVLVNVGLKATRVPGVINIARCLAVVDDFGELVLVGPWQ